mmetsp:Transcript_10677/g.20656  ORF Transcript_10677/g.20656 Transcript_10677/m.20656 type:complete len:260 (-) Transcript_10677:941-1720(-)
MAYATGMSAASSPSAALRAAARASVDEDCARIPRALVEIAQRGGEGAPELGRVGTALRARAHARVVPRRLDERLHLCRKLSQNQDGRRGLVAAAKRARLGQRLEGRFEDVVDLLQLEQHRVLLGAPGAACAVPPLRLPLGGGAQRRERAELLAHRALHALHVATPQRARLPRVLCCSEGGDRRFEEQHEADGGAVQLGVRLQGGRAWEGDDDGDECACGADGDGLWQIDQRVEREGRRRVGERRHHRHHERREPDLARH